MLSLVVPESARLAHQPMSLQQLVTLSQPLPTLPPCAMSQQCRPMIKTMVVPWLTKWMMALLLRQRNTALQALPQPNTTVVLAKQRRLKAQPLPQQQRQQQQ